MNKKTLLQWKLRRMATRARGVLDVLAPDHASVDAFRTSVTQATDSFIVTYDRLTVVRGMLTMAIEQARRAAAMLNRRVRSLVGLLAVNRSLTGFDPSQYGDNPEVVDDVIQDGKRFIDYVAQHADTVPEAEQVLAQVRPPYEAAVTEWTEAEVLRKEYQELVEANRTNALVLHDTLVAFRRAIALAVGRGHPGYQRLRMSKIKREILEEGEQEALPEPTVPALVADEQEALAVNA